MPRRETFPLPQLYTNYMNYLNKVKLPSTKTAKQRKTKSSSQSMVDNYLKHVKLAEYYGKQRKQIKRGEGLGGGVLKHPGNRPRYSMCNLARMDGTLKQGKKGGSYIVKKSKTTGKMYKRYC